MILKSRARTPEAEMPSNGPISAESRPAPYRSATRALVRGEAAQGVHHVEPGDPLRRIRCPVVGQGRRDLDHRPPATTADDVTGLVGSDRDEPRSKAAGIADGPQLPPADEPCRLHGIERQIRFAADPVGDTDHVAVVGSDDPCEGGLVPGCRVAQGRLD